MDKKQTFNDLKEKIQAKIAKNKKKKGENYVVPTPPRYDDLFFLGQDWLDGYNEPRPKRNLRHSPCSDRMCGADDCPACRPGNFIDGRYIEDEEKEVKGNG